MKQQQDPNRKNWQYISGNKTGRGMIENRIKSLCRAYYKLYSFMDYSSSEGWGGINTTACIQFVTDANLWLPNRLIYTFMYG